MLVAFLSTLVPLVAIDAIWLYFMAGSFYKDQIGHLMAPSANLAPVFFFYIFYAIALNIFVIRPELLSNASLLHVGLIGMLFGFITYATYDLTNQATLKNWSLTLSLVDMAWGSILVGLTSVIAYYVQTKIG